MKLIIAEKPSVGRAIAAVVGGGRNGEGCIHCDGGTVVTWAYGHLLQLDSPEDYVGRRLEMGDLPLIPGEFRKRPRDKDAAKQLKVVVDLISQASEIVHAGDPDREGQLLVDEVLQHAGWTGPTKRLWLSAVDPASVRKALSSLKSNDDMADLSASAECRSRADWLVGMNGSIALSRKVQAAGGQEALSVGRVQTPTLALVVKRDAEIAGFTKRMHYTVCAVIDGGIRAKWRMPEDLDGLSDDGLLLDKNVADQAAQRITSKPATVTDWKVRQGSRAAPLPHCLSTLQKVASSRFGMSAKATLAAAQALYEGGFATYPRTDCQYLPNEQHDAAGGVLQKLLAAGVNGAAEADPALKHAAWSTEKVEAHHAIVPTGKAPAGDLTDGARKVYDLIAAAFIRLFHPPEKFETREAVFDIDGLTFIAKSRTTMEPGWTRLGGDDDENDGDEDGGKTLPDMAKGDQRRCERGEVEAKETKPPKPYTDGTLIAAMTRVHSLIEDPKLKARLRETSGLGTEATRAGIIETLLARGYLDRKGKNLISTAKGQSLIRTVRQVYPAAADPGVTAVWEDALAAVSAGKMTADQFMQAQKGQVGKLVAAIGGAGAIDGMGPAVSKHKCPECGSGLVDRKTKKGFRFYSCSGCDVAFFREKDGKPGGKLGQPGEKREQKPGTGPACPDCGAATVEMKTKSGKPYLRCPDHGAWWPAKEGEGLGTKWPPRAA